MRDKREKNFTQHISQRLISFSEHTLGLSPKELAEILGCDTSMVYRIKRGVSLPDIERIVNLWSYSRLEGTPLNFEWLLTGQASLGMFDMPSIKHIEATQALKKLNASQLEVVLPLLELMLKQNVD